MSKGLPLIVTRPDPGGATTVLRARKVGLDARHCPLFAVHPLAWTVPDPVQFDALLLTSAQAARLGGEGLARLAALPVHAVGPATADAACAAGLNVVEVGAADGQTLIGAMTSRGIKRILWLCARDRTRFDARGAAISAIACYAADAIAPPADWPALIDAPAVLLAHSRRAAERIAELVPGSRGHLALGAISVKAASAAGAGWAKVAVAERPDDAAMLALARALCHKG
ncbi:uroporphyrinogen-III synthase [Sphingopyxis flava]|uniref:Uroporphyrinogen-III synthase n=1 Tax=Sphingopyxis flava TaxID=1507287 RepID=A0A1T5B5L2_9SPHN|nr:uroporphyrinogen-III synthase [Sphingopyxis flava]SKB42455.1 uroporphyrinogen-III synthase [Sphingopyxis flava]